ncbi:MAG: hypothetical protein J0M17_16055 [Planctomycetes bacterium]|nr:hypothetical protein [Planctomycetota bacterium]
MTLDPAKLIVCLTAKQECLTLLRALGLQQRLLIEAGEMTNLLQLLAEKQRTILRLQEVERELDPFRNDDPDRRAWPSQASRLECAALAERCERLLADVLDCEKTCEEELRRRRDETARELTAVNTAGAVHGAYVTESHGTSSMLDLSADY